VGWRLKFSNIRLAIDQMEKNKEYMGKVKLNDELLDKVSGGYQIIEYDAYRCTNSACDTIIGYPPGDVHFCPNCGAKMELWTG